MLKIEEIAEKGNNLETLKALRQNIARAIDSSNSGRDISSLSRQLQLVLERIAELEAQQQEEVSVLEIVRERHKPVKDTKNKKIN